MKSLGLWRAVIFVACSSAFLPCVALANNEIFPAVGDAASAMTWKDGYFYINGKPTFITSGEMHYARIPQALWADRIWRAKQMGFNCVQTYVFWNASEPTKGHWDFTGGTDLDAWLSLVQKMGMYATVRVGPYCCAEWDDGGLPAWLLAEPGITLRDGGIFEQEAKKHLDQVESIVAKHQIQRGGSVILVQLENEHPRGWGTDESFPYLKRMVDQARANGLNIPVFLSGLHHGGDPSGGKPYAVGTSPWFTTEFWTGWIGKYGDMEPGMLAEKIRGTWKIIAFGGGGYDYYMVHGGTNFGYSGFSQDATYDYSAPIGETGRFNNFYWHARRAAYFAQSFSPLLTGSHDDPALAQKTARGLRVLARTNPSAGSIVFLDVFAQQDRSKWISPDASAYAAPPADASGAVRMRVNVNGEQIPKSASFSVTPNQPHTVLLNIPWTKNARFAVVCSNVMLRQTIGKIDYWVCYGDPGDAGEVKIQRNSDQSLPGDVQFTYPSDESVKEIDIDSGDGHAAKLLVMNTARTEQTWLAGESLYIGPAFVLQSGRMEFGVAGGKATIYSAQGKREVVQPAIDVPALPQLEKWSWRDASGESSPNTPDTGWLQSTGPHEMASYEDFANRYGWYRTTLHCANAGPVSLHFAGLRGTAVAFMNGELGTLDHLDARVGDNELAILMKANPRPTMYNVTGSIGDLVARGLWGSVSTERAPLVAPVQWEIGSIDDKAVASNGPAPDADDAGWHTQTALAGSQVDLPIGSNWLRGTFDLAPGDAKSIIDATGVTGKDITTERYVNGQKLAGSSVDGRAILRSGKNVLLLHIVSRRPTKASMAALRLWHADPVSDAVWFFHPGLSGLDETQVIGNVTNWQAFLSGSWQSAAPASQDRPTFWHTSFVFHHNPEIVQTIGLTTEGMKSGNVWLNGHNLGECPQKVPMYMPECWINEGENDLVAFDLAGAKPDALRLTTYETFALGDAK